MNADCPWEGVWSLDKGASESLCEFMGGLFNPYVGRAACLVADAQQVTLRIACGAGASTANRLSVVDKTSFGRNETEVTLDGVERPTATRGGRKTFMLSGSRKLHEIETRGAEAAVIRCRLHQRGDGWETRQERFVSPDDPNTLVERNVLERPDKPPIVSTRLFRKDQALSAALSEELRGQFVACMQHEKRRTSMRFSQFGQTWETTA